MKLIRQRVDNDCGYAAIAMMTGKTYDCVAQFDPDPECPRGLSVGESIAMLEAITGKAWRASRAHRGKPIKDFNVGASTMVCIRAEGRQWGHWVVANGLIFDPESATPVPYASYGRGHWNVIVSLTPS